MNKPAQVYVTYIRTTAEKVWEAITKPEFTKQYWAGAQNVSDWQKGSKWEHVFEKEADPVWVTGEVLECSPPSRLVISWIDPDNLSDQSRVTFDIQPEGDSVCLKVTHDQFTEGFDMDQKVSQGWPRVLSSMKSYLETGQGLSVFCGCKSDS